MKKQLNEASIVNELTGQSAFFPRKAERTPERANTRTGDRPNTRTGERMNGRTHERAIVRHSFNFYGDQVQALQHLEAESVLRGKKVTLSDLVRQALDEFLERQK